MLNSFYDKFIFTGGLKYMHNNFYLINIPFVILPTELIASLAARQNQEADLDIYYCTKEATRTRMLKQFDIDFGLEGHKAMHLVGEFFSASGWGSIEVIDQDIAKKRAIVVVKDSPVAGALRGKARFPVDHLLRGVFAGLFSHIFSADVECVETKCSALNEPCCEFVVKEAHEFDFEKTEVRRQIRVE